MKPHLGAAVVFIITFFLLGSIVMVLTGKVGWAIGPVEFAIVITVSGLIAALAAIRTYRKLADQSAIQNPTDSYGI